jgi:hypothetical protein
MFVGVKVLGNRVIRGPCSGWDGIHEHLPKTTARNIPALEVTVNGMG